MLHIATVHFKSPRWIQVQVAYIRRFIPEPYQTWTSLEGIDASYGSSFDHVIEQKGPHGEKLNHLALEISHVAADDDLLLFLDGDAFPIADLTPVLVGDLADAPLVAVRRAENGNDPQPHPCFCLTTVGFWRSLPGDWGKGYTWGDGRGGRATDVGANLLRALELNGAAWTELLRSNGSSVHPLWFAVYGDAVYHHGAGFRDEWNVSRLDLTTMPKAFKTGPVPGISHMLHTINRARSRSWRTRVERENRLASTRVFEMISQGDPQWLSQVRQGHPN